MAEYRDESIELFTRTVWPPEAAVGYRKLILMVVCIERIVVIILLKSYIAVILILLVHL